MYRTALANRLTKLEELIDSGRRRIEQQERVIANLEKLGKSTVVARKLLVHLEEIERSHKTTRDLLASRLARL
jgi:5-methylcytosine-specific restriction endonuclease McrBC regulatory subunit McrC